MKSKLLLLFLVFSTKGFCQVIADPALSEMSTAVNSHLIPVNNVLTLKVPVQNRNSANSLPPGTCKIKIGLGSKMELAPGLDLTAINTSNYFNWTTVFSGGQVQITGELVTSLPANFSDTATFEVRGTILGSSTITTNFLITNHNTTVNLSDEDPTNNSSFLPYTVNGVVPVTFTKIVAGREGCFINLTFDTENEINVSRYEIEVSKDAVLYEKKGILSAGNLKHYKYLLALNEDIKTNQLFIRIKSVDNDGRHKYSETRSVSGTCENLAWKLTLYPNPAIQNEKKLTIETTEGMFNGRYTIFLADMSGKILTRQSLQLLNSKQLYYGTTSLAAGQYFIRIQNNDGTRSATLKFQKL